MFILFFVASIVSGFFLAGIPGALLFGLFNSLALKFMIRKTLSKGVLLLGFAGFSSIGYMLMIGFGLLGASENVHRRVEAIREHLEIEGYSPRWFIIS